MNIFYGFLLIAWVGDDVRFVCWIIVHFASALIPIQKSIAAHFEYRISIDSSLKYTFSPRDLRMET